MGQHTLADASGGIRRGPRRADNFTIMSNAVVNDERLSFRARGILIYLLSKPADWRTRSEAIAERSPREGREAIRTAMRELESFGYLVREKVQNERGQWATIQTVYEEPATLEYGSPEPGPRNPGSGDADNGEPGALTKDGSPSTETNNHPASEVSSVEQVLESVSSSSTIAKEEIRRNRERIAALETATLAAGLPASYAKIKPAQKTDLLSLLDVHGIDRLVEAAKNAHRPENPTMHVHGWIRLWNSLPLPRAARSERPKCSTCEGTGFVLNDDDLAVYCECRSTNGSAAA